MTGRFTRNHVLSEEEVSLNIPDDLLTTVFTLKKYHPAFEGSLQLHEVRYATH